MDLSPPTPPADGDLLARGLGLTSLGLGTAMLTAAGPLLRLAGIASTPTTRIVLRARGTTELLKGLVLLFRRQPVGALRARLIGDVVDLGLLAAAPPPRARWYQRRGQRPTQVPLRRGLAGAAVAGIGAMDLVATRRTVAFSDRAPAQGGRGTVAVVTIARPLSEVADHLDEFEEPDRVSLQEAPGGRGTEVRVTLADRPDLRRVLLGRRRSHPAAMTELRRFKQRLEAGTVVRSDGAPEGPAVRRRLLQRAGQPG